MGSRNIRGDIGVGFFVLFRPIVKGGMMRAFSLYTIESIVLTKGARLSF